MKDLELLQNNNLVVTNPLTKKLEAIGKPRSPHPHNEQIPNVKDRVRQGYGEVLHQISNHNKGATDAGESLIGCGGKQ